MEVDCLILNEADIVDFPKLDELGRQVGEALGGPTLWLDATVAAMLKRGLYLDVLRGPREVGGVWWAGWTGVGCTGWNGGPDYYTPGATANEALWRSAWLALVYVTEQT